MSAPIDPEAEQEVDFGRYWRLIGNRWWVPIAGLVVGLLLASVPLVWLLLRRGQRSTGPSRPNDAAATNRRNQAIVEGAGEGVLELDNVGQVRYANPAAAKLLGYEIEELPGLDYRLTLLCHPGPAKLSMSSPSLRPFITVTSVTVAA